VKIIKILYFGVKTKSFSSQLRLFIVK